MKPATRISSVPIESIRQTPENWRIYTKPEADDQFPALVASVRDKGVLTPLDVSKDGFVLSGNRRHAAAEEVGLETVPIIRHDVMIGPMPPEERGKVLVAYNHGTRVKTVTESITEAMMGIDASEAIRAAENRKANVFTKVKTSRELVEGEGGSRRTDPKKQRSDFLGAVIEILHDLEDRDMLPISARHIHYKLLAGGVRTSAGKAGHPYGTKQSDCKLLSKLLTDARSAGIINDSWLSDETRPSYVIDHDDSISDYVAGEVGDLFLNYYSNVHRDQPAHVEIIVEKNTVFSLLQKHIAHPLRIPISSARGYLSYPAAYAISERFKKSGKDELHVVYVSDHDPEGMDMPKAVAKYLWEDHQVGATVIRAAVTDEQIETHNLPPDAEAKVDSSRFNSYVDLYGLRVWELDSMDPEILIREVKQACLSCLDVDALNAALEREQQDDVKLARLNAAVAKIIPDLLHNLENLSL